ncbi:MAG TPA: polymer-forming cytoskeletal protein [Steroidobacteraceae bacterium]
MALWKEPNAPTSPTSPPPMPSGTPTPRESSLSAAPPPNTEALRRPQTARGEPKESLIAADLTIEGKIEGSGHVRIAGSFKGDVNVQGNLTIEGGARVTGQVRASTVVVAGELHGNIEAAVRVELQETGMVVGDVKAGSLTVAAGSRMRGQVEFGWGDKSISSLATAKVDAAVS